jgi:hypothetical protein
MPDKVQLAQWFCWSDGMVTKVDITFNLLRIRFQVLPFGLFDVNGNEKPSYFSFANFSGIPYRS